MIKSENIFIKQFTGAEVFSGNIDNVTEERYTATLPYSLDTIRLDEIGNKNIIYSKNNKQYTDAIIQLDLTKEYKEFVGEYSPNRKKKTIASKLKIRKQLYKEGFNYNKKHYVFYKRSAGKAKTGLALFIEEKYCNKMIKKSRMNLTYKETTTLDVTSLRAYETLVQSGLCSLINIDTKEIMIVDDIYGNKLRTEVSVTRGTVFNNKMELTTQDEILEIENCLTDGQSLADESLFKRVKHEDKGFMLLRNDYMKTCSFNTKLQKYFKLNNVETLTDMFGRKHKATDIKLVLTPNSVKIWKIFGDSEELKDVEKCEMWDYYISKLSSRFGIVKYDKEGNYGTYNRATYQMLNATNLDYDALKNIASEELKYVEALKNDLAVFKNHINVTLQHKRDLAMMLRGENSEVEYLEVMSALITADEQFAYTDKFKTFRRNMIEGYIKTLRKGKIRMKDTRYVTVFANPYEMLKHSIGKYDNTSNMCDTREYREIYCSAYSQHSLLATSRNPHLNHGCLGLSKVIKRDEYKYFNLTDNICIINLMNSDSMDRYGGLDMDSDTILLTPQKDLVRAAARNERLFKTPINKVEGSKKGKLNDMNALAKLDCMLSGNYIGKICNKAQIVNSYLNHAIANNEEEEIITELYNLSSRLSSLSQIEIDRSKKVFEGLSMDRELKKINNTCYDGKQLLNIKKLVYDEKELLGVFDSSCSDLDDYRVINTLVLPSFFRYISKGGNQRIYETMDTPMDILQDVLNTEIKRAKSIKKVEIADLLIRKRDLDGYNPAVYQILKIEEIVNKCARKVTALNIKSRNESDEKLNKTLNEISKTKIYAVESLSKIKMTSKLALLILRAAYGVTNPEKYNFSNNCNLVLSLLFKAHQHQFLECFVQLEEDNVFLEQRDSGSLEYFGVKYELIIK